MPRVARATEPQRNKRSPKTRPGKKNNTYRQLISQLWDWVWRRSIWRKLVAVLTICVLTLLGSMYAVAQWYIHKHANEPLMLGTTFIPEYAESFGLDPKDTLQAVLGDLGMRRVRLVSYWNNIEKQPGKYDFSELDWEFKMAQDHGAQVSLAIGLRQPRWPECHVPTWAETMPKNQWQPALYKFMDTVIDRYKNNPVLKDYQLENEFFMTVFGKCQDFDRNRLVEELALTKKNDPYHPVIISRSNNWVGLPAGKPTPDQFGISVYKRVWDKTVTHRYFEYPLPAWFYSFLAGAGEILTGKDMIIHELQAEPWTPNNIHKASLAEQYKSINPQRMSERIAYGEATGMKTIDLWGAEWWYWMKVKKHQPGVWNVVKGAVAQAELQNRKLTSGN